MEFSLSPRRNARHRELSNASLPWACPHPSVRWGPAFIRSELKIRDRRGSSSVRFCRMCDFIVKLVRRAVSPPYFRADFMKPAPPLSTAITVRGLVAHMRRQTPRPIGERQSAVITTAAFTCISVGLLALGAAFFVRAWAAPLGFIFLGAWIFGAGFLFWAVLSPVVSLILHRASLIDALADLADRRRKGVRDLAHRLAEDHGAAGITEAQKAVQSEIAGAERRKFQMASMTALGAAVAALAGKSGLGEGFDNVAQLITAAAPALGVGAGIALVATLDFLDILHRVQEALAESLTLNIRA
jgi:hypothetical protein